MIRYYGAYARRTKKRFGAIVQSSIKQLSLRHFGFKLLPQCPFCKSILEFVWYCGKPPPKELKTQQELTKWISENSLKIGQRS